jgi:hypothetical protein
MEIRVRQDRPGLLDRRDPLDKRVLMEMLVESVRLEMKVQ